MNIGYITLNFSFCIYLIWFVPQIILNFKRKDTEGLSMLMHGVLCIGYLCDLIYGFGREMQWQYRMVTIVGLFSLSIQHYQFGRYGLHKLREKYIYLSLSTVFIAIFCYAIFSIIFFDITFFIHAGLIAHVCWLCFAIPQIIQNYARRSTAGLSSSFVIFAIVLNIFDFISAWSLGWDYPSKIGPLFSLCLNVILLLQIASSKLTFPYYAETTASIHKAEIFK